MSVEDIAAVNTPELLQKKYPDQESCVAGCMKDGMTRDEAMKACGHIKSKQSLRKVSFAYQATFEPYEEQGKHLAKIHVIDLAPNKNDWQVTAAARAKALKTLLDAPLLGPPPDGEKGNVIGGPSGSPHEGLWSPVGRFVGFQSNHVTHGIAEITKDYAWEKIKNKEWDAVSPSVLAFVEHREGDVAVVDDFNFEHVLFVDKGAYPEAGVESTCDGDLGSCGFYQALATASENQARPFTISDKDLSIMEKAVQSARGILTALEERLEIILGGKPEPAPDVPPLPLSSHTTTTLGPSPVSNVGTSPSPTQTQVPEKKMGQKMEGGNEMNTTPNKQESDNEMDECKELQARIKELEPLQTQVAALKSENELLKAFKAEVEKKARAAKVQTIVDLKTHCGMLEPKDHAQAYVELEKLSADALDAIEKELTAVQARLDSMPSGPKAKHTAEQAYNAIEDARERMFGYRRDEHGEIIGGK